MRLLFVSRRSSIGDWIYAAAVLTSALLAFYRHLLDDGGGVAAC